VPLTLTLVGSVMYGTLGGPSAYSSRSLLLPKAVGATATVTLTNVSMADLTVTEVSLTDGTHFSIAGFPAASFILTPGSSQQVTVTFDPTAVGSLSDTLSILSDDPDEGTVAVALSGAAVVPDITVTDSILLSNDLMVGLGPVLADGR